jgi:hypothetical protein
VRSRAMPRLVNEQYSNAAVAAQPELNKLNSARPNEASLSIAQWSRTRLHFASCSLDLPLGENFRFQWLRC